MMNSQLAAHWSVADPNAGTMTRSPTVNWYNISTAETKQKEKRVPQNTFKSKSGMNGSAKYGATYLFFRKENCVILHAHTRYAHVAGLVHTQRL